jgi:hypothetical protein
MGVGVVVGVGVRGFLEYLKELRLLGSTLLCDISSRVVT